MGSTARRALLAMALWTLWGCQSVTSQHTVADIHDQLFAPKNPGYSLYIRPKRHHGENVRKRQADFSADHSLDDGGTEPLPEPEATNTGEDHKVGKRDGDGSNVNIPGAIGNVHTGHSAGPGNDHEHALGNIEILSFQPHYQRPNAQFNRHSSRDVPRPLNSGFPVYLAGFDPKLQPGYGHDELEDKMDSYAVLDESEFDLAPQTYVTPAAPTTVPTDIAEPEPRPTKDSDHYNEKSRIAKKLLEKPKKVMKVIKASQDGDYVPQEVPGVMLKTVSGEEEAFVPADLLEDTERLITSASDQQPSFADPSSAVSGQAPMRGMPYQFGWIVDDEATANYQTRQETGNSDGVVTGCYQVLDPTGLVRTVIYRADENGFRVLSLSRGPDKTPCPGLDDATRSPLPSQAPTPSPRNQPRPTYSGNTGGFSNADAQQGTFNKNFFSESSSSSSSSQSSNSSSQSNQYSSFSGKNGLFEQPSLAKTLAPSPQLSGAANLYNLQGSAQQAWMAEYLQNITKNLYNSFTNSSTISNTKQYGSEDGSDGALVNFPFVLIPISTFLDLQENGAIGKDIQSYGAFIQPEQGQAQLSQYLQQQQQQRQQEEQQQQQKQKAYTETTHQTTFNTYNTTKAETQQKSQKSQGVNTINFQTTGIHQQGGHAGKQAAQQQQYQSHQSSESSKSSSSSSSSNSSSSVQSNFAGNQGYPSGSQFNQARPSASSYGPRPNSGIPGLSYGPPQRQVTQAPYVPQPPQPFTQRPVVTRPSLPIPPTPQPSQYRPTQQIVPQVPATQNYGPPSFNNGASGSYSSQNSQSSQQSQSSQEKQASSSSSSFGNGRASQSYQSSSSKEAKEAKSSKSSSSSQFSYNSGVGAGAGVVAGNQYSGQLNSPASPQSFAQRPVVTRPSPPIPTTPQPIQYRPTQKIIPQVQATQNYGPPSFNNGASGSYSSQDSKSSQQSQSSQEKQASSSSSSFGNGGASQSYQSSSSKEAKDAKSSKSASSTQFAYNTGAGVGAGHSAQSKSTSSSASSSSSSSSSQQSFNSFNSAGANSGLSYLPTHLTQGFPSFPELNPSPSTATATYVPTNPSQGSLSLAPTHANFIPHPALSKGLPHHSYQEESIPVILAEANTFGSSGPSYNDDYDSNGSDPAFEVPLPEPNYDNTNSWIPLPGNTNTQQGHETVNIPGSHHGQNTLASPPTPVLAQQFYPDQLLQNFGGNAGNVFHQSSSSQSSQEKSSSQQSHQESSSSWSGSGALNPQHFFSKAIGQESQPSQKQPRQLPAHQIYQTPSWAGQQSG